MAQNKCPLCGEKVINGSCSSCGYVIPDEASVAAPYNYDPSDYTLEKERYGGFDEEAGSEYAMPEIKAEDMQEIVPAPPREARGNNPQNGSPYAGFNPAQNNDPQNGNPYAGFNPAQNNNPQNGSPYANFNPVSNQNKVDGTVAAEIIIAIILTMFFPVVGIIYSVRMAKQFKATRSGSYRTAMILIIIATVLSFMFRL